MSSVLIDFPPLLSSPSTPSRKKARTVTGDDTVSNFDHWLGRHVEWKDKPDNEWTWQDLRDYVVHKIAERHGPFELKPLVLTGIFKRYFFQYGVDGIAIARHAFEVLDGKWANEPITVQRFCKANDPYFTRPIYSRISGPTVQAW